MKKIIAILFCFLSANVYAAYEGVTTTQGAINALTGNGKTGINNKTLAVFGTHQQFPVDFTIVNANPYRNNRVCHWNGPVAMRQCRAVYTNYAFNALGETAGAFAFTIRSSFEVNGNYTPITFGGVSEKSLAINASAISDAANITIPPYGRLCENTYQRANNTGAGSYSWHSTSVTTPINGEGTSWSASPVDWSMGDFGTGVVTQAHVNGSGVIDYVTIPKGGNNYTAGLTWNTFCGVYGCGNYYTTVPGSGGGGYGTPDATGFVSSITVTSGGSGFDSTNTNLPIVALGAETANGYGTVTSAWSSSIIMCEPDEAVPSVAALVDSWNSGGGNDIYGRSGNFELAANQPTPKFGMVRIGAVGLSGIELAIAGRFALTTALLNDLTSNYGLKITHLVNLLGVNDFNTTYFSKTQAQAAMTNLNNVFRNYGAKIFMATVPPATNAANSAVTNSNYNIGGHVQNYNSDLLAGVYPVRDDVINQEFLRDSGTYWKWASPPCGADKMSADGVHLGSSSTYCGLGYYVNTVSLPAITVP